jgi:hypothetical protein
MQLLTGLPVRAITEKIESRLRSFSMQIQKLGGVAARSSTANLELREMNALEK